MDQPARRRTTAARPGRQPPNAHGGAVMEQRTVSVRDGMFSAQVYEGGRLTPSRCSSCTAPTA